MYEPARILSASGGDLIGGVTIRAARGGAGPIRACGGVRVVVNKSLLHVGGISRRRWRRTSWLDLVRVLLDLYSLLSSRHILSFLCYGFRILIVCGSSPISKNCYNISSLM